MTTCPYCARWASTTEQQWMRRRSSMRKNLIAEPASCPKCGSIDWALTRDYIAERPDKTSDSLSIEAWIAIVLGGAVLVMATVLFLIRL
jgi:hypothetical protein